MKIWTIWVREREDEDATPWCVGAWDEETVAQGEQVLEEAVGEERNEWGTENVRVIPIEFDGAAVRRAFANPPVEQGRVLE